MGVEIDFCDVCEGDLFFVLWGESMDGYCFVVGVFVVGVVVVVVDWLVEGFYIFVKDIM